MVLMLVLDMKTVDLRQVSHYYVTNNIIVVMYM